MSVQHYILLCSVCGWKRLTDGTDIDDLVEVKNCRHCSGGRQFKCPSCGRLVKAAKARVATVTDADKKAKELLEKAKEREKRMYNKDMKLPESPKNEAKDNTSQEGSL